MLVIEGHRQPVQHVRRSHRKGASASRADRVFATPIIPCREALFADLNPPSDPRSAGSDGGSRLSGMTSGPGRCLNPSAEPDHACLLLADPARSDAQEQGTGDTAGVIRQSHRSEIRVSAGPPAMGPSGTAPQVPTSSIAKGRDITARLAPLARRRSPPRRRDRPPQPLGQRWPHPEDRADARRRPGQGRHVHGLRRVGRPRRRPPGSRRAGLSFVAVAFSAGLLGPLILSRTVGVVGARTDLDHGGTPDPRQ